MKVEKFKVLLYLKKSGLDKSGKAPIMGRITVNRTMAQFSCKLSCTPGLWNPRESRLNGKSREAVETNAKIDRLLLDINAAFDSLLERKTDFDAASVKDAFQGSMSVQMTLMKMLDAVRDEVKSRSGIRKKLETEYLAQSLQGHIQYYATSYSRSPDHEGRAAIRYDGNEIIKGCYWNN